MLTRLVESRRSHESARPLRTLRRARRGRGLQLPHPGHIPDDLAVHHLERSGGVPAPEYAVSAGSHLRERHFRRGGQQVPQAQELPPHHH